MADSVPFREIKLYAESIMSSGDKEPFDYFTSHAYSV